jgi:hypothetical protein
VRLCTTVSRAGAGIFLLKRGADLGEAPKCASAHNRADVQFDVQFNVAVV